MKHLHKSWRLFLVSFLAVFALGLLSPAFAVTLQEAAKKLEEMTWYTEEYPPYNFAGEDGKPTGMAVDILVAAFKKLNVGVTAADISIAPWNRSYKYVQEKPGTALFSMTYTPEREKILRFVGPAIPLAISVIAPMGSGIVASEASDLRDLTIGVVRDDIGDQLVRKMVAGANKVRRITTADQLYKLIEAGKVDVVVYAVDVFKNIVKKAGGNPSQLEEVLVLSSGQSGYAFHKSTDPEVLQHLQRAVDELRADGTIDKIISGYNN